MQHVLKKWTIPLIGVLISFFILATSSCSTKLQSQKIDSYFGWSFPKDSLDAYLKHKITAYGIPGLAIAIVNNGQIVHHQTYGYANVEQKTPVTTQTIFEGASISKSVFGHFVMTYVEDGTLDLDKPLYEYLPYPDLAHDERYKKITARMALSHRTGLPNWRENEEGGQLRIKFEPGTSYEYSGEAYQYLAMVLKAFEGDSWDSLEAAFQERIAKPLGLEHTVFIQTPYTKKYKAEPYDDEGNWINWKEDYWTQKNQGVFGAAFSIHSEAIDFSKWMIGVMNKEILSQESYDKLFKSHAIIPDQEVEVTYTLGFFKYPFPIANTYGHGGNNEGFTSYFTLDTDQDWGYVLFTNSEYGQQLGEELFFYLLTGPNLTIPYVLGGFMVVIIMTGLVLFIRFVLRRIKSIRPTPS